METSIIIRIYIFSFISYMSYGCASIIHKDAILQPAYYLLNESSEHSTFKRTSSGFTLRIMYGDCFDNYTSIEKYREDLGLNYMWSMNNAAWHMIRIDKAPLNEGREQILNISLNGRLSKELDSIALKFYHGDTFAIREGIKYLKVSNNIPENYISKSGDTTYLYYENPWCQAFKNLAAQQFIASVLGDKFVAECLSKDGSESANKRLLKKNNYIDAAIAEGKRFFSESKNGDYYKYSKFYWPVFNYRLSTELDFVAGFYYRQSQRKWYQNKGKRDSTQLIIEKPKIDINPPYDPQKGY